jgi:two-component system sensor histidine kinase UhpB
MAASEQARDEATAGARGEIDMKGVQPPSGGHRPDRAVYLAWPTTLHQTSKRSHRSHPVPSHRAQSCRDQRCVRRLDTVLEWQARAIGQSLHDEAGQLLTAAHLALADAARGLPPPAQERLLVVRTHLAAVEEHLRHLARELHPRVFVDGGFVAALEFLARGFAARHGISTTVNAKIPRCLPDSIATALYRMGQEGLTNISRHARATRACIRVASKAGVLRCTIRDDGVGFDVSAVARRGGLGLGLQGIRERLAMHGGVLQIKSVHGVGTQLIATIPLEL